MAPEPEPEPEPETKSMLVASSSASSTSSTSSSSAVSFADNTKTNDGPRPGAAATTGRVLGKAVAATLGQIGALVALIIVGVLCVRLWSGSLLLWEGSLDPVWSRSHKWNPNAAPRGLQSDL